jgi:hypothetical protein
MAQAPHASEYRHRRLGRRSSAGRWLGGGERARASECLAPGGDHLHVDTAAFLGAVAAFTGLGGPIYLAVSALGGLGMVVLAVRLVFSRAGEPAPPLPAGRKEGLYDVRLAARPARDLFAFSLLYLFVLFAALLVERIPIVHGLVTGA